MDDNQQRLLVVAAALLLWDLASRLPRQALAVYLGERRVRRARKQAEDINRDLDRYGRDTGAKLRQIRRCANCGQGSFCLYNKSGTDCSYDWAHRRYQMLMQGLTDMDRAGQIPVRDSTHNYTYPTWPSYVSGDIDRVYAEFVETERRRRD